MRFEESPAPPRSEQVPTIRFCGLCFPKGGVRRGRLSPQIPRRNGEEPPRAARQAAALSLFRGRSKGRFPNKFFREKRRGFLEAACEAGLAKRSFAGYIRGKPRTISRLPARLCPCFARVMFFALRAKRKGVCAVRTHFEGAVPQNNAECGIAHSVNSVRGAGAPSPPSEEGGGCLHKGFEQADGGRETVSMRESSRYSRQ